MAATAMSAVTLWREQASATARDETRSQRIMAPPRARGRSKVSWGWTKTGIMHRCTSSGVRAKASMAAVVLARRLPRVVTAPLGAPVVPEVKFK